MNIGMILDNEFTGDMRVENEVISLRHAGFSVFVLALNHGSKAPAEDFHGAAVVRLPIPLFIKNKMKGLTLTVFDCYKHYWSRQIRKFIERYDIQALHVHDLYLLGAAFHARDRSPVKPPIIADLHENYPYALMNYKFARTLPGRYIISIPKWIAIEKVWVERCDHVITVIEEAKVRYQDLGVASEKISVVANYVSQNTFQIENIAQDIMDRYKGDFVISYAGGFDYHRGLATAIGSVAVMKDKIPNLKLVLIGEGRNKQELMDLARSLHVSDRVDFEGWQKPARLASYFNTSRVCLIPHMKSVHTDNGIPHKLFQYMLMQKPVIASNCNPLVRILDEAQCGVYFTSGDERELAQRVEYLYHNPELMKQMGAAGREAVVKKYNWNETAKNLISLYTDLEKINCTSPRQ